MDVAGHDANLAFAGLDDTGAVRSNKSGLILSLEDRLDSDHIQSGNTLSDADDKFNFRLNSLLNGVGSEWRGDINDGSFASGVFLGFTDSAEHGQVQVSGSGLSVVDTTNHLRSVGDSLLSVESTLFKRR